MSIRKSLKFLTGGVVAVAVLSTSVFTGITMMNKKVEAKAKSSKIVLTFWHGMESGENNAALKDMVKKFNKTHKNIEVKLQGYGAADQVEGKIMTALQGHRQPDLMWWASAFTGKFAQAGVLAPVSDFIKKDKTFKKSDIYKSLWDVSSYKGKIYTAPFDSNNLGIFYNKDLFKKAGITKVPTTWSEFTAAAKKLTVKKGGKVTQYGFQVPIGTGEWTVWTWETLLWQAGGEFLNSSATKAAFNSSKGVAAINYWKNLMKKGYAYFSETDAGYKTDDFETGKVAMQIIGPWTVPQLDKNKKLNYGTFFLPKNKRYATNIGGENLFIFKSTPAREKAAWEFTKYVMSKDVQTDWAIRTGYLPVCKSASTSVKYKEYLKKNPNIKVFVDQMDYGFARPSIPAYAEISTALGKQLEQALYGKISPKEALSAAADYANNALSK